MLGCRHALRMGPHGIERHSFWNWTERDFYRGERKDIQNPSNIAGGLQTILDIGLAGGNATVQLNFRGRICASILI